LFSLRLIFSTNKWTFSKHHYFIIEGERERGRERERERKKSTSINLSITCNVFYDFVHIK